MAQSARNTSARSDVRVEGKSYPPLTTGTSVVYYGDDQNGIQRPQQAMVLNVVGDASEGIVDVHIFNGAMISGTQDQAGVFIPEYVRKSVPHATSVHNEGWHYPGEFEADIPTAPPAHVDVPHAYQEGVSVYCTMGNWETPPLNYAFQWRRNGSPIGESRDRYDTVTADIGQTVDCVVTTTNAAGSSSVISNPVLVEAPAGSRVGEHDTHIPTA